MPLEDLDADQHHRAAKKGDHRIAHFPVELRHIGKVHTVPAHDQRQRQKDRGQNGKGLHNIAQAQIQHRLICLAELSQLLAQGRDVAAKALGFVGKATEQPQLAFGKQTDRKSVV